MNSVKDLIKAINENTDVVRFKELEKIIDNDNELSKEYKKLIDLQKDMVQKEAKNHSKKDEVKQRYNEQLDVVMGHYLMQEYLDVLQVVNDDLQMIKEIITQELNVEK